MSRDLPRRRFLELLNDAFDSGQLKFFSALAFLQSRDAFKRYLAPVRQKEWVVYAKPPFADPRQVLDYLGRYTHRVAISNNRLIAMDDDNVQFHWRNYADDNQPKVMSIRADEFIRRFLLHTLPLGLQRIRYYGLRGGSGFSDTGVSGVLSGQYSNRRADIHEKAAT
jgi:hypothetical protein